MKIEKKVTLHLDSEEVEKLKKILLFASLHFNYCIKVDALGESVLNAGIDRNNIDRCCALAGRLELEM